MNRPQETSAGETGGRETGGSWYDDAPTTEAQLDAIRADLGGEGRAQFSQAAVRKLLAEVERLRAARASAIREWKRERDAADELQRERDAATQRAETAERELASARMRMWELRPAGYEYRANGPFVHEVTEGHVSTYPDGWADGYWPERRPVYAGTWERMSADDGAQDDTAEGEREAADGG